jgi:hypothetical protein
MVDITNVLGILESARGTALGLQNDVTDAVSAKKSAISETSTATQSQIANKGLIDLQVSVGELEAQKRSQQIARSIGTDMTDMAQIATTVGASMKSSGSQVIQAAKEVNELESNNNLLTNPLGFFNDLLFGGEVRGRLSGAATEFDAASKVMANLNQATQASVVTQKALAETHTDATIAAQKQLIADTAAVEAGKSKQLLAGADIELIGMIDGLNARQASMATSAYHIQAQAEQQAWMRADREAAKAAEEEQLKFFNAGAALTGQPKVTTMAGFRAAISANKGKVNYLISRGAESLSREDGKARIASNPLEFLTVSRDFGLVLNPAQENTRSKLNSSLDQALQVPNAQRIFESQGMEKSAASRAAREAIGDKKQWPMLQEQWLRLKAGDDAAHIRVGDSTNIYAPPSLDFIADKPFVSSDPFLSKYIKPLVANQSNAVFDPSTLLKFSIDAALKDKIPTSDIAESIAWIAKQAELANNASINYPSIGLPAQRGLRMTTVIDNPGRSGGSVKDIDISDPTAVEARIIDYISNYTKQNHPRRTPRSMTNEFNRQ